MIELSRSPVDGHWRAWALFERSRLGELQEQEPGTPDVSRWVCVAVARTRSAALKRALDRVKRTTPPTAPCENGLDGSQ